MFLQFLDFFANTGLVSSSNLFSADGLNKLGLNLDNGSGLKLELEVLPCSQMCSYACQNNDEFHNRRIRICTRILK